MWNIRFVSSSIICGISDDQFAILLSGNRGHELKYIVNTGGKVWLFKKNIYHSVLLHFIFVSAEFNKKETDERERKYVGTYGRKV